MPDAVTPEQAVEVLNRALALDHDAVKRLIEHRVPCAHGFLTDPTIQVGYQNDDPAYPPEVGMLGIINGIFGVDDEQWGFIEVAYEDDTFERIIEFRVRS